MNTLFIYLAGILGSIATILGVILRWNRQRFKDRTDNDTVKRKEISVILEGLYKDTKKELGDQKRQFEAQIKQINADNKIEAIEREKHYTEEIRKRDVIIIELISRLPREAKEAVQEKIKDLELDLEIK